VQSIESTISHEVVEAATDPLTQSWVFTNPTDPWFYLTGELGDMCESNTAVYTSGSFVGQLIWSNAAAADGGVPCQPWPAQNSYLSVLGPQTMAVAPAGGSAQVTLTGWASGAFSGTFELVVQTLQAVPEDGGFIALFDPTPTFSSQTIAPGGTVTATLHVPASAASGQSGALWVLAADTLTGAYVGSTVIGITAQ
jgi:hypothetical protein